MFATIGYLSTSLPVPPPLSKPPPPCQAPTPPVHFLAPICRPPGTLPLRTADPVFPLLITTHPSFSSRIPPPSQYDLPPSIIICAHCNCHASIHCLLIENVFNFLANKSKSSLCSWESPTCDLGLERCPTWGSRGNLSNRQSSPSPNSLG